MNKTLPIWRDANRLLLDIESSVRCWPRYHKYTLGTEMRVQAMKVCRLINRAWRERSDTLRYLHALVVAVDDLKLQIQLGKELGAFRSFAEFQRIAGQAVSVGKQSGGWRRHSQSRQPETGQKTSGAC